MDSTATSRRTPTPSRPSFAPLLLVCVLVLFAPVVWQMIANYSDYQDHIRDAQALAETGSTLRPRPHFLYHVTLVGLHALAPAQPFEFSAFVLSLVAYAALALLVYAYLGRRGIDGVGVTLALMVAAPLTFATWAERNLYFGYIVTSTYHNPTVILLRPLAFAVFWYVVHVLNRTTPAPRWQVAVGVLVAVGAALAKPSYTIALVPALVLVCAYRRLVLRRSLDWAALTLGFAVPSALVLLYQYLFLSTSMGSFALAPLVWMGYWSDSLLVKFAASVAFPLLVTLVYWDDARRDSGMIVAWLAFLVSLVYLYGLIEQPDWRAGNFVWGAQVALFVLFVQSTRFLLTRARPDQPRAMLLRRVVYVVLVLHVVGGGVWYAAHASGQVSLSRIDAAQSWW